MKISFVIPAYNEENYLKDCLQSIFNETKGKDYDFEVIVVNNASTDNTKQIAKEFKNVKVVDEEKRGLVVARKAGYQASTGDLIANVDADTRLTPGWIDTVLKEFSMNKELVALSGPFIYYDLPNFMKMMVRLFYYYTFSLYLIANKVLKSGAMLQGGNFVLKRSAFEKVGGYDVKHYTFYGEDADVAVKMFKVGKVKWTFRLPINSSGRRLAAEGPFTMMLRYTINYFWVVFFGKPFTTKFSNFRFKTKMLSIRPKDPRHEWLSGIFTIITLTILPIVVAALLFYALYYLSGQLRGLIK
ncbi:glycosyltransferase [Patescibacteria group bacterium]|nr:glycosyltransferase [Patescibacteria group bacterium]